MEEFIVKSKQIADYLIKHGSEVIRIENGKYIFEKDNSIELNLSNYKKNKKRCYFGS